MNARGLVVEEIAYHRNGVAGAGFHVVKFSEPEEERRMLGVVFDNDEDGMIKVAVFDRRLLAQDVIAFARNSWRGDRYEAALREAIARAESLREGLSEDEYHALAVAGLVYRSPACAELLGATEGGDA